MHRKVGLFLMIMCFLSLKLFGQLTTDSLSKKHTNVKASYIISSTFLIGGVALNNSDFEKNLKDDIGSKVGNDFNFPIDDYAQYAPIALIGIANIAGLEARNHWFDQGKYLVISNLLVSAITHGLKRTINKTRPNGESYAFPSGHTSFSFTNAMVLYKEYQVTVPFLAYSGFAFSGTTATFRMLNNKHWLSDVLAGAGIAMIVTELVYHFEPLKNFNPFLKQNKISILPQLGMGNEYGLLLTIQL